MGSSHTKMQLQSSVQLSDIIALSSFEIVKNLKIPMALYLILITIELAYMISIPADSIVSGHSTITTLLFEAMGVDAVYMLSIVTSFMVTLQIFFLIGFGWHLKIQQSKGDENKNQQKLQTDYGTTNEDGNRSGSILQFFVKLSGVFMLLISTCSQFIMEIYVQQLKCDMPLEIAAGCDRSIRKVAVYVSIIGIIFMIILLAFHEFFIRRQFPDKNIPWASWNDSTGFFRHTYKLSYIYLGQVLNGGYFSILTLGAVVIAGCIVYDRCLKPPLYNRIVHQWMVIMEAELLAMSTVAFFTLIANIILVKLAIIYCCLVGLVIAFFILCIIDKKEQDAVSIGSDIKNYKSLFQIELFVVKMLHELEKFTQVEEYGQEKHIHSIVSKHMEECVTESCPCKNYEPEYDKKFTTVGSKRITKSFSMGGGSLGGVNSIQSIDLKKLPYKISYKTKLQIFKQEVSTRIDTFLEAHPKSHELKLLKSFFHHKYSNSSYKALFVQLENAATCKNFRGKVFIYHLKTQIQDEMKTSMESPLNIDINSLLKFEKLKINFERCLEELSYNCQVFWTDLIKEEYNVDEILETAYTISDYLIQIKSIFARLVQINSLCIDTSSTYALIYRYILRDEATFTELVNRIQQIKNSSKLEQQRETGIRFFDSDVYALLLVSGETKELGRVRQATSSCKFVFGYEPKDLIGFKINKLMPSPFAQIHDKFLTNFLAKGNSTFLEQNQALPILTKDGYLSMILLYVKPIVSLHVGLIFTCFAKILNKYRLAVDSAEYIKINKLCIFLTDKEGYIHGMTETCTSILGLPPPKALKQLSINDNQLFNISQIVKKAMVQEYEFELVKGVQMQVDTTYLNKERQFRREFPEYAIKIGKYQAEVGIHRFQYREIHHEINVFVLRIAEGGEEYVDTKKNDDTYDSKSIEELTYSIFSITTANSSVSSSSMATSKFKTFKSKVQQLNMPSQVKTFQRLSLLTFVLLLSIAAGNFAVNQIQNKSYLSHLQILTNLQILIQNVPEAAHSARELVLIANNLVQTQADDIIKLQATSKFNYYQALLHKQSKQFEDVQQQMQTTYKNKITFDSYMLNISDIQTDGEIKYMLYSTQTALNLFSSTILTLSSFNATTFKGQIVPKLSFDWNSTIPSSKIQVNQYQQDLFFVIQNGLQSLVFGLKDIQSQTIDIIDKSSTQAALIAIILAVVSIFLVIVLLPLNWPTLTHIEKITYLILSSLNRLPEAFCQNEIKACLELIIFLNEQKAGEKSTHQMIKKHEHRKNNREILKLPKTNKNQNASNYGSANSSLADSEISDNDKGSLLRSINQNIGGSSINNQSNEGSTASIASSKITSLSRLRQSQGNQYQSQQQSQMLKVKRNEGGTIELDLAHAKTSELLDDDLPDENQDSELSETEIKQRERERDRKIDIKKSLRSMKIRKFIYLMITAMIIAFYFGITSFYLNYIHKQERNYSQQYQIVGQRIQCYTNGVAYVIDSLARGQNIKITDSDDLASDLLDDCYQSEQDYHEMILEGTHGNNKISKEQLALDQKFDGDNICKTLVDNQGFLYDQCISTINGVLKNGLTQTLYLFLANMQKTMRDFNTRFSSTSPLNSTALIKKLLIAQDTNELISLNEVYFKASFSYIRTQSLQMIQQYFQQLNSYYNMLFGIFFCLLCIFQLVVSLYLVKRLSKEIIKMYHVVMLIPFSGRTQDDLNRLMMIRL